MTTTQTSFAGGVVLLSSTLDDVTATQLGLKQYLHGTTYNGGIAPTVTSAQGGFTVTRAVFVPYQMQDGAWRVKFNIDATYTSATVANITVSVNALVFKNVTNSFQAVVGTTGNAANVQSVYVSPNTTNITLSQASTATCVAVHLSGDVELNSKPTWAY